MTNTTNLGLTQYDTTDKINFVTEYNSDMEKIDIAVGNNADLDTTDTSSLVNAINENVANTASNVITSGSNTNGSWTKFPDGTMICISKTIRLNYLTTGALTAVWNFPISFIDLEYYVNQINTIAISSSSANKDAFHDRVTRVSESTASLFFIAPTGTYSSGDYGDVVAMAIGKWK